MAFVQVLTILAILGCSYASTLVGGSMKWDGLRITWGPNLTAPNAFMELPRTTHDARQQDFVKFADCSSDGAKFRGNRYVRNKDFSLILLFDTTGYIAGIQTMVPKGQANGYPKKVTPPFVQDGDNFYLTVYFVDPDMICSKGRTPEEFEAQGTGTDVIIQNGNTPDAQNLLILPHKEKDIKDTRWKSGMCYKTMGVHYWRDLSKDMDCDAFFPVFALYSKGRLNALGLIMTTHLTSKHLENLEYEAYVKTMTPLPDCLSKLEDMPQTAHIFLTNNAPYDDMC